ncbi:double-strand break repair protein AddB [Pseudochelatococcus contaminans]|uniref:ATP-dependent helicase/nuclease subunit B n=1 Tax=Pseudochelatococcus contaminans TaxID=1538103 RepID=A0A7W5Z472_9HYPH|nr:ATP-dependent helicase/nuclease subunit B [Pseudochelatococcus contaminans]
MTDSAEARPRVLRPHVFNIVTGAPFLPTLADALLSGRIVPGFPDAGDPLSLSRATIYLPTRRAARALATLLAERAAPAPVLLPRLVPLGDVDDAELALSAEDGDAEAGLAPELAAAVAAELAPAIGDAERRLILTRLVLSWARAVDRALLRLDEREPLLVPASPADALALAGDLARLMDSLTTEDVPWDALRSLVEERHSQYFAITLAFLKIAAEQWPAILAARKASDPVARHHKLTLAQAEYYRRTALTDTARGPTIVAGSTGSVPATAQLIAAIAHLPQGAVVLPGLDDLLDPAAWALVGGETGGRHSQPVASHPQAILHRLLDTIGVTRADVVPLGVVSPRMDLRRRFISEALRPAETTDRWHLERGRVMGAEADPLAGIALIEAADERTEALAAAIALREALEGEGKTAALVTPDRALAERVGAELLRWGIVAEDSAGLPLTRARAGTLARLVAQVAVTDFAPEPLLALLAHPLATFGLSRAEVESIAATLEIGLLRGPALPGGVAGMRTALPVRRDEAGNRHAARPIKALTPADWDAATAFIDRLADAFAGFTMQDHAGSVDLVALVACHATAVSKVAATEAGAALPAGEGGPELAALFDDIAFSDASGVNGRFADYPAFFDGLASERVARRESGGAAHPRVKIWGLLEARLLDVDRIVLGGLDEGVWPPKSRTDAFLNRPMRGMLGLSAPERRIGQTAHDFAEALGTDDVVITRALKRDGAPTVPSRFLQRMKALAGAQAWSNVTRAGERYLALAAAVDTAPPAPAIRRPAPKPPRELLPKGLSVTAIETLVRDPYAVYARHVLKLDPLDAVATPPGAANRGTLVHEALGNFAIAWPGALPADPLAEALRLGREAFVPLAVYPEVTAMWWPRFEQVARAYVDWEIARRPDIVKLAAEIYGRVEFAVPGGTFTLSARADRIETWAGHAVIVDFKTGAAPTPAQIFAGFAPQMTLEAAMLKRGAFDGVTPTEEIALLYMLAKGGRDPLAEKPVEPPARGETRTVAQVVEEHFAGLQALLGRYYAGKTGFASRPFAEYAKREGPYDHLARVREWSVLAAGEDA